MQSLKYTVIKNQKQYYKYCDILEELVSEEDAKLKDEVDLLTLLIEKWDAEHNTFEDPIPG